MRVGVVGDRPWLWEATKAAVDQGFSDHEGGLCRLPFVVGDHEGGLFELPLGLRGHKGLLSNREGGSLFLDPDEPSSGSANTTILGKNLATGDKLAKSVIDATIACKRYFLKDMNSVTFAHNVTSIKVFSLSCSCNLTQWCAHEACHNCCLRHMHGNPLVHVCTMFEQLPE